MHTEAQGGHATTRSLEGFLDRLIPRRLTFNKDKGSEKHLRREGSTGATRKLRGRQKDVPLEERPVTTPLRMCKLGLHLLQKRTCQTQLFRFCLANAERRPETPEAQQRQLVVLVLFSDGWLVHIGSDNFSWYHYLHMGAYEILEAKGPLSYGNERLAQSAFPYDLFAGRVHPESTRARISMIKWKPTRNDLDWKANFGRAKARRHEEHGYCFCSGLATFAQSLTNISAHRISYALWTAE